MASAEQSHREVGYKGKCRIPPFKIAEAPKQLSIVAQSHLRKTPAGIGLASGVTRPFSNIDCPIYSLRASIGDPGSVGCMLIWALSRYTEIPGESDLPIEDIMGGFFSMLIALTQQSGVMSAAIVTAMREASLEPIITQVTTPLAAKNLMVNDARAMAYKAKFIDFKTKYLPNLAMQFVMPGVVCLAFAKNIVSAGYSGWVTNRVRSFLGKLGLPEAGSVWTEPTYPSISRMQCYHRFFSAHHTLRKLVFEIYKDHAQGEKLPALMFQLVVELLHGTEMNHILLIDMYLYNKYKEILYLRALSDYHSPMLEAWKFLESKNEEDRFYAKLLFSPQETKVLNRTNFRLYAAAAVTVAQHETPSFMNYKGGNIGQAQILIEIIKDYLEALDKAAHYRMINTTDISDDERAAILAHIEREVEIDQPVVRE